MKQRLYVCNKCKDEGKDFSAPADFIGVELMKAHLWNEHQLNVAHRKACRAGEELLGDW